MFPGAEPSQGTSPKAKGYPVTPRFGHITPNGRHGDQVMVPLKAGTTIFTYHQVAVGSWIEDGTLLDADLHDILSSIANERIRSRARYEGTGRKAFHFHPQPKGRAWMGWCDDSAIQGISRSGCRTLLPVGGSNTQ